MTSSLLEQTEAQNVVAPADSGLERRLILTHNSFFIRHSSHVGEISSQTAAETIFVQRKTADECSTAERGPRTSPASGKKITFQRLTIFLFDISV